MVTPELFGTETRTMGHSACTAVSRVGSFFASFLVVSELHYVTIGVVLGVLNFACALTAHTLPDTTGETLAVLSLWTYLLADLFSLTNMDCAIL